jgi:hypothetical protein
VRRAWVGILVLVLVAACSSGGKTAAPSTSPTSLTKSTSPTSSPPDGATGPSTSATLPAPSSPSPAAFGYVPLWPFASVAAAEQWQREAVAGGHQPWRLDAGAVALAFVRQYLLFTEIDRVVSKTVTVSDARVTVGYPAGGANGSAAMIHLVRIGSGAGQPWEVVGTVDNPSLSMTQPRYGSTVAGTITVGGHVAGVDESIRVTARQLAGVVGAYCCLPAGAPTSWSARLRLTNTRPGPVTIVASTGGHLLAVERFTVTGVRSGS